MKSFLEAELKYVDSVTKFNNDALAKIKDSKKYLFRQSFSVNYLTLFCLQFRSIPGWYGGYSVQMHICVRLLTSICGNE